MSLTIASRSRLQAFAPFDGQEVRVPQRAGCPRAAGLPALTDVFRRRGWRACPNYDVPLGADAYVVPEPAFVTGLRDWRRTPAISTRQSAHAADGEWQPL